MTSFSNEFQYKFDSKWREVRGNELMIRCIQESTKPDARGIQSGDTLLLSWTGRTIAGDQHGDNRNMLPSKISENTGEIFQEVKGWLVTVGDPNCWIKGMELGVECMKEGETAWIFCAPKFHFAGSTTETLTSVPCRKYQASPTSDVVSVPITSSVIYDVTVTQIVMDTSRLNPYFPIQKALAIKKMANDLYQCEWALGKSRERTIALYEKAAKQMKILLDGTYFASVESDHPQRQECKTIVLDCKNNVVATYLRAKRYAKAREAVKLVLREEPRNKKALVRNVKAHVLDPKMSSSSGDVEHALEKAEAVLSYRDVEEAELRKLKARWKQRHDRN